MPAAEVDHLPLTTDRGWEARMLVFARHKRNSSVLMKIIIPLPGGSNGFLSLNSFHRGFPNVKKVNLTPATGRGKYTKMGTRAPSKLLTIFKSGQEHEC